jgi:hypothetical protein
MLIVELRSADRALLVDPSGSAVSRESH